MNLIVISGNIGNMTANQVGEEWVIRFSVGVGSSRKDKDGKYITDWFSVDYWTKSEKIVSLMKECGGVTVQGEVYLDTYTAKDGSERKSMKVKAHKVDLHFGKKSANDKVESDEPF